MITDELIRVLPRQLVYLSTHLLVQLFSRQLVFFYYLCPQYDDNINCNGLFLSVAIIQ